MNEPAISWYVVEENEVLIPQEEYYAGSYRPGESVEINLQVWNNRWGSEDTKTAIGCRAIVFFDTIEDSALLKLCKVMVDNVERTVNILDNKAYVDLPKDLYGIANNGSPMQYVDNFSSVKIRFGPVTNGMKNSIKSLYVDLQFESREGSVA